MRIVAGAHRGRVLTAPNGRGTRPTADRTRQALFNVLEHARWAPDLAGARVADLFAGSGALGLEALSRGADACLFVDDDPAAVAAIRANVAALGQDTRSVIRRADARKLGPRGEAAPFDLAFLDPPYALGLCEPALAALLAGTWLAPGALAVAERGAGEPDMVAPGYEIVDSRAWGAARVWFLRAADAN